jgi:putative transposase
MTLVMGGIEPSQAERYVFIRVMRDIMTMILTTSNYLRLTKKQFKIVDTLCLISKNLYNVGLYNVRQYYLTNDKYLPYPENYHHCKDNENYKLLHSDNAQQTLKVVDRTFKSYFGLIRERKNGNYNRTIRMPHYLDKNGRFVLIYPAVRLSFKDGCVSLGMSLGFKKQFGLKGKELTFKIPEYINPETILEVRIIPVHGGKTYKIEYVYEIPEEKAELDVNQYLSIDLGLDNFATIVNTVDGAATIIDGKHVKSINRYYNKENARLQSIKDKQKITGITNRQSRLTIRRNNQINEFLNRAVSHITKTCLEKKIGNIVIGELTEIKQEINIGKRNNQNFVSIPYFLFKRKLKAKCERYGIQYHEKDEAYTSRTDALAMDEIKAHPYGKSRRVKRGLYQSSTGVLLNADVNGSLNIMRKVASDSLVKEIVGSGLVNRPRRIRLAYEQTSHKPTTLVVGY